ncbi:MAG: iron-containing alcohol dehydrogenase [Gemmataceae bacterium]|nr:iron-containing alcohol dehydrogenase [Gemmataceae bacterium]
MSSLAVVEGSLVETLSAFDYVPLGRLVFGAGTLSRLGELVRELGGQRVLLVTDPGLEATGNPQRAIRYLTESGLAVAVFDGVEENPESRHVRAGVEAARAHQADFLVAIGGGSAMDCAKGINFLYTNGGTMAQYRGFGKATKPMLPSIGVPTTAGTGSEAQSYALIADDSTHLKMACGDRKAAFRISILDPELTLSQPPLVTAVTGLDAIVHAVESYVSTRRNPISQAFSLAAWRLLEPNFSRVLSDPQDLNARGAMQLGAYLAGMAIEAAMLGAAHSCANPLTAHYGTTHGLAVAILLPHVVRFNAPVVEPLYADLLRLGQLNNGEPPAEILARRIESLVVEAGLPSRLGECGVAREILPILAEEAHQQWTARFNPRPVTEADLLRIYESAW